MKRFQKISVGKILVGILAIGGGCILLGFVILSIDVPSIDDLILSAEMIEQLDFPYNRPFLDPQEPIDLILEENAEEGQVAENGEAILPYSESMLDLKFQFVGYLKSLGGEWRGNSAEARIVSPYDSAIKAEAGNINKDWGGSVVDELASIRPSMNVEIPLDVISLDDPIDQRFIQIDLSMDLTHPVPGEESSGNPAVGTFVNRRSTLEHTSKIYILTPEETETYFALRGNLVSEKVSAIKEGNISFFIGSIGIGIVIIILVLVFSKISGIKLDWRW